MATDRRHHHQQHRPQRLSVPPRTASRAYPLYPQPSPTLTPTPTPSKHRLSGNGGNNRTSLPFLLLLLFSLRSLYSLLPFLRSSPSSLSLFPFSFLVSLFSFLLTLSLSLFPLRNRHLSLSSIESSHFRLLLLRSAVLAVVFLLRFQALRYCGTAAMILSELSGNVAFQFLSTNHRRSGSSSSSSSSSKVRASVFLLLGMFLLSVSWDRLECFPFSFANLEKFGTSAMFTPKCVRIGPMLLPFLSGFLGCYERDLINSRKIKQLGQKRIQLVSLFLTTVLLFFPALISFWIFEEEGGGGGGVSITNLIWPLANTVVFGVLLNEWYTDDDNTPNNLEKQFLVTFAFTVGLELVYYPDLSLWGLLICGFLFWIAARQLNNVYSNYVELGMESPGSPSSLIMKPIRHILSERKSRKIALFLIINTLYMFVEFIAGFMSNSLGLISDACHMLFDCAALAIGLYASYIARLPANGEYNYGRGRFEVLSGYANAVFLVLVGALIVLESFERILDPQEISTNSLLVVSVGGLLVNVVGLVFFHEEHHHAHGGGHGSCSHSHSHDHKHHIEDHHSHVHVHHHHEHEHEHEHNGHVKEHHDHSHDTDKHHHAHGGDCCDYKAESNAHVHEHSHKQPTTEHAHVHEHSHKQPTTEHRHIDHNMEGIFLHVLADTLGSVGVVISTLLIKFKGWLIADPACSIFISVLIVSSVIPLLRNSAEILLQRTPRSHERDLKRALNDVMNIKGVCGIQNLHVWSLTNADVVGTLHLHVSTETDRVYVKNLVSDMLKNAGVKDLTIQVECVQN